MRSPDRFFYIVKVKAIRLSKKPVYGKMVLRFVILPVVQIMSLYLHFSFLSVYSFLALFFSFGLFMDQKTFTMRKKEGLADYRYFPEPDLPEVVLTKELVDKLCQGLPELPEAKRRRYEKMGLAMQDVLFLANDNHVGIAKISGYFRDK